MKKSDPVQQFWRTLCTFSNFALFSIWKGLPPPAKMFLFLGAYFQFWFSLRSNQDELIRARNLQILVELFASSIAPSSFVNSTSKLLKRFLPVTYDFFFQLGHNAIYNFCGVFPFDFFVFNILNITVFFSSAVINSSGLLKQILYSPILKNYLCKF